MEASSAPMSFTAARARHEGDLVETQRRRQQGQGLADEEAGHADVRRGVHGRRPRAALRRPGAARTRPRTGAAPSAPSPAETRRRSRRRAARRRRCRRRRRGSRARSGARPEPNPTGTRKRAGPARPPAPRQQPAQETRARGDRGRHVGAARLAAGGRRPHETGQAQGSAEQEEERRPCRPTSTLDSHGPADHLLRCRPPTSLHATAPAVLPPDASPRSVHESRTALTTHIGSPVRCLEFAPATKRWEPGDLFGDGHGGTAGGYHQHAAVLATVS